MMMAVTPSRIAPTDITTTTPIPAHLTDTMVRNGSITASSSVLVHGTAGDGVGDGIATVGGVAGVMVVGAAAMDGAAAMVGAAAMDAEAMDVEATDVEATDVVATADAADTAADGHMPVVAFAAVAASMGAAEGSMAAEAGSTVAAADSTAAAEAGSTAVAAVGSTAVVAASTVVVAVTAAVDADSPLVNKFLELAAVGSMLTAVFFAKGTECHTVCILRPVASAIQRTLIV
ncbi:MAG TPA: hypothetical protein VND66_01570 [Acidobacteriaceae bacterium]|nr:hypothetical protein [Acidobacteriaceae bacterium]